MLETVEEHVCFFGTPLEPYDEDAFPKKKPISVEDQTATDSEGRRRFHGAFTGGFSAGFYNTVGSLEGWLPREFKSTKQEKAETMVQKPEDFMDDEDVCEFGISPQTVRATKDYSTSKKRKKQVFRDGPIPGEPVLHSLLASGNDTIGHLLIKNMSLKNKTKISKDLNLDERIYGCEMPNKFEILHIDNTRQYKIPDIYKGYFQKPKDNTFGLGYVCLDKSSINLFQSSKLVIRGPNKKKISIIGQAFGVGAFEDDDEDIYVKEDMSKYDFELTKEKKYRKSTLTINGKTIFDDFIPARNPLPPSEMFLPPTIRHSFTGQHKVKKSRFEPLPETPLQKQTQMTSDIRAKYLGDSSFESSMVNTKTLSIPLLSKNEKDELNIAEDLKQEENKPSNVYSIASTTGLVFDRFVSASKPEDQSDILQQVEPSETIHGTQEMCAAAKMKMFGPLTRISSDWQPCSLLCKRFNVPEPHFDELNADKTRKRTKNLIFEYEKFSDVTAFDFKPGFSLQEGTQEEDDVTEITTRAEVVHESHDELDDSTKLLQTEVLKEARDITDKINVEKNIDLFKAVFLNSSESEGEEENEKTQTEKNSEIKDSILSDTLLPKIKPLKEGILSNMDFLIFEKSSENTTGEPHQSPTARRPTDELSYGPALPARQTINASDSLVGPTKLLTQYDEDESDEWVEKSMDGKSKNHKKKHKNKKSSHKKKHKHKGK